MRITDGATPGSAPGSAPLEDVAGGAGAQPPAVPPAAPRFVERSVETRLPTRHGVFRALGYREHGTGQEHLALVLGRVEGVRPPLVRVHSECLTGDVLGSQRCDCGPQLDLALRAVAREGAGVVVYLRGHEGRGIGLVDKLRAYALQDDGADTVDANLVLGLPVDARDYAAAAGVLLDLQVPEVRLLTNNPAKVEGLRAGGVEVVGTVPLRTDPTPANLRYLRTKRQRCGHDLGPLEEAGSVLRGL